MNKSQALNAFWNSFGIPAFDENSVPDDTPFPYITYMEATDCLNKPVFITASIWDKNVSWERISLKANQIAEAIGAKGFARIKLDEGYLWLVQGSPFAQRMGNPDSDVKRIYLNVQAEFLTSY